MYGKEPAKVHESQVIADIEKEINGNNYDAHMVGHSAKSLRRFFLFCAIIYFLVILVLSFNVLRAHTQLGMPGAFQCGEPDCQMPNLWDP